MTRLTINATGPYFVYFNLHVGGYSLRSQATRRVTNRGRVVSRVILRDVTFRVNENSRQRVIREKSKNVHAGAVGTLVTRGIGRATVPVSYNPYKAGHFYRKDTGEAVYSAKLLVLTVSGGRPVVFAEF